MFLVSNFWLFFLRLCLTVRICKIFFVFSNMIQDNLENHIQYWELIKLTFHGLKVPKKKDWHMKMLTDVYCDTATGNKVMTISHTWKKWA
jgi:hypothetical protein